MQQVSLRGSNNGGNGPGSKPETQLTNNNGSGYLIPQLGGEPQPLVILIGLALIVMGLLFMRRRHKEE